MLTWKLVKSYQSSLAKNFKSAHPNIVVLVTELKKKQQEKEQALQRLDLGHPPPTKKHASRQNGVQVLGIKEQLQIGQRDMLSYMVAIGLTIELE